MWIFLDSCLPPVCMACGRRDRLEKIELPGSRPAGFGSPGLLLCQSCRDGLSSFDGTPRCGTCSAPVSRFIVECERCRGSVYNFQEHRSAYLYRGTAAAMLRRCKFSGHAELVPVVGRLLAARLPSRWRGLPVVPVPSRRRSVNRRGFDLVGRLAAAVAESGGARIERLLKNRGRRDQKTLSHRDRQRSVSGQFVLHRHVGNVPPVVLLVDDVFTTGATLSECARVLRRHGCTTVFGLSFVMEL